MTELSNEEIDKTIKSMKRWEAPGVDEITSDVLNADRKKMIDMLCKIFNQILYAEKTILSLK